MNVATDCSPLPCFAPTRSLTRALHLCAHLNKFIMLLPARYSNDNDGGPQFLPLLLLLFSPTYHRPFLGAVCLCPFSAAALLCPRVSSLTITITPIWLSLSLFCRQKSSLSFPPPPPSAVICLLFASFLSSFPIFFCLEPFFPPPAFPHNSHFSLPISFNQNW